MLTETLLGRSMTNEELNEVEKIVKKNPHAALGEISSFDTSQSIQGEAGVILRLITEIRRLREQCNLLGDKHQVGQ